jgi:MFS transporter, DHA2 family, multidrug resistance protein
VSNAFERNVPVAALASTSVGFAMMCVGMSMAILDVQVVATSLPTIQSALDIPPNQMSWVQTAYLIAEVVAIPLTGFLTRLLSMCWLFVLSISIFTLASVGCAASDHFPMLIACRVLQGFSGGTSPSSKITTPSSTRWCQSNSSGRLGT